MTIMIPTTNSLSPIPFSHCTVDMAPPLHPHFPLLNIHTRTQTANLPAPPHQSTLTQFLALAG